jgi:rod shape-determining protein MreD
MNALKIVLLALVIFILQLTMIPHMGLADVYPKLMIIFLVALVLDSNPVTAVIIGFVLGFLQDLGNAAFLGANALAKSLVAYGIARFGAGFLPENLLFKGFIVVVACLVNDIVFLTVTLGFAIPDILYAFFRYSLLSSLYTALIALVIYFIVEMVTGRMVGVRGGK